LQAVCRASKEPLVTEKEWRVQFSIPSADIGAVLAAIANCCRVSDVATEWTDHSISPRNVKSSNLRLLINGESKILKKLEWAGWSEPIIFLNFAEAISPPNKDSIIRKLDAQFRVKFPQYKLVNYGPLPKQR
jgi:hypothetical protein